MTEKMKERNAAICAYYKADRSVAACAEKFGLGRQRVLQILQKAGVWKPIDKGARTKFLGVSVKDKTKEELGTLAKKKGVSVSRFASDVLDKAVSTEAEK